MTKNGYYTPFSCSYLIKSISDIILVLVAAQTEHNNVDEYYHKVILKVLFRLKKKAPMN